MHEKKGETLHHYVVRAIGQQIVSGQLAPGALLPDVPTLCAKLKVSRTALREALIVLAAKGLIQSRKKAGTVVRPPEEWNMLDGDLLMWRVESADGDRVIGELYDLRRLIEPLAASLAATHAKRSHVDCLRRAYEDMVVAGDDGDLVLAPDVRFHRAVIGGSGNALFSSVGLIIASALDVNFKAIKDSPRGHAWALPLHKAILDAIAVRDADGARLAMQKLLDASERDLRMARKSNAAAARKSVRRVKAVLTASIRGSAR